MLYKINIIILCYVIHFSADKHTDNSIVENECWILSKNQKYSQAKLYIMRYVFQTEIKLYDKIHSINLVAESNANTN